MGWLSQVAQGLPGFAAPGVIATPTATVQAMTSSDIRFGCLFDSPETGNLTDIWIAVDSYVGGGTWGTLTDGAINYSIHIGTSANFIPAGSAVYAGTIALNGSTTGWVKVTGLTHALTRGQLYVIAFHDADPNASEYVTLARTVASVAPASGVGAAFATTNAWTSGSNATNPLVFAMKINGQMVGGSLSASHSTVTTGTYARGILFTPPEPCRIIGVAVVVDTAMLIEGHTWKLFASTVAPSGTAIESWTNQSPTHTGTGGVPSMRMFNTDNWPVLDAGVAYRFVIVPSTNRTVPRRIDSFANLDADLRSLFRPLGGDLQYTYEDSSAWVDVPDSIWNCSPVFIPARIPAATIATAVWARSGRTLTT